MGAIEAFIHEYRLTMPIGVDEPSSDTPTSATMAHCEMRGTPITVLVGRDGVILHHGFCRDDDSAL